jgi:glucose-1-phosphate adenylyltransferase
LRRDFLQTPAVPPGRESGDPMARERVLAMILAGGKGERLDPLTRDRSKPAVPFGGRYRIVDFVLSNFVNSGILGIYVLVQYKSQSLIEHLRMGWRTTGLLPEHFIAVVPPQMRHGEMWYRGTADAVYQNLNLVEDMQPDLVAVFGADHIYRMDVNQMIAFHREHDADVTVAARPVSLADATQFGVIEVDASGRIVDFQEKPEAPRAMPGDATRAYVSMGNYVFSRRVLAEAVLADAQRRSAHDFGRTIIPELFPRARVFAYDFAQNEVAGVKPYEEPAYWRDVGTIEAYFDAHMDLLGEAPAFDLDNRHWPIMTGQYQGTPARISSAELENIHIGAGSFVKNATIRNAIIGRNVWINEGAVIEESVVMDTRLRRTIVDRFNIVGAGKVIGVRPDDDRQQYHVDASGIVVIPRGGRREFLRREKEF